MTSRTSIVVNMTVRLDLDAEDLLDMSINDWIVACEVNPNECGEVIVHGWDWVVADE
jgi:hypothetical protein